MHSIYRFHGRSGSDKNSKTIKLLIAVLLLFMAIGNNSSAQTTGYAPVNGLKMYYEVHGEGEPIILLHGAYMTIEMNWSEFIPELSKTRKVIVVEMQGHGRTADIDRQFSYSALADDVAELLKHLDIKKADILGYSFGGTIALQFGIKYPQMTDKMVIISTTYKYDGWLPEVRETLNSFTPDFFDNTPLKSEYEKIAPDPEHWKKFVSKLMTFDKQTFNLGEENLKNIKSPILFLMGDNDGVDLNHVAEMYKLCGGNIFGDMKGLPASKLAILPGSTHVGLMQNSAPLFAIITPFLDEPANTGK